MLLLLSTSILFILVSVRFWNRPQYTILIKIALNLSYQKWPNDLRPPFLYNGQVGRPFHANRQCHLGVTRTATPHISQATNFICYFCVRKWSQKCNEERTRNCFILVFLYFVYELWHNARAFVLVKMLQFANHRKYIENKNKQKKTIQKKLPKFTCIRVLVYMDGSQYVCVFWWRLA